MPQYRMSCRLVAWCRRVVVLIALAHVGATASNTARACPINAPGILPTYGAFALGGIDNSPAPPSCTPGYITSDVTKGSVAYYTGTDINPFTYANSPAVGSASGAIGTASWGMSSASADLSTGDITVSSSSTGNAPFSNNPLPTGAPAGAQAGYFVQIVFSGGNGQSGSVSLGGLISYSGNVSANVELTFFQDASPCICGGYNVVAGNTLPATVDQAWSVPAQGFTIKDGVPYTLSVALSVSTSGSFLPGSVQMTDPISLNLPAGVTYTASDPQFLTGSATPEPASLTLVGTVLIGLGLKHRRKRS